MEAFKIYPLTSWRCIDAGRNLNWDSFNAFWGSTIGFYLSVHDRFKHEVISRNRAPRTIVLSLATANYTDTESMYLRRQAFRQRFDMCENSITFGAIFHGLLISD